MRPSFRPRVISKKILGLAIAGLCCTQGALRADDELELLTVGSKAPTLDVSHWISNGKGAFKPVTKFQAGKVYVVEFWATWCGPCIASMPHLAKLQQEYADRGVQIVSISDEDEETVKEFLKRDVAGPPGAEPKPDSPKTYADLTSVWCLTADPDGSSSEAYLQAARQGGIPTAFIVGKTGQVEWIGHPSQMDEPLELVVGGKWDRESFRVAFQAKQEAEMAVEALRDALANRKFDEAIKIIDKQLQSVKDPQQVFQFQMTKLQVLMVQGKLDLAAKHLEACYASAAGDPNMIDAMSWHIFEQSEQRKADLKPLLKIARDQAQKAMAAATGEAKGSLLDTTAHLTHKLGELDAAIELAKQAVASSSDQNKQFSQQFLEQLNAEKAAAGKPDGKEAPKK